LSIFPVAANGIVASINQIIDYDTAEIVAAELGFDTTPIRPEEPEPVMPGFSWGEKNIMQQNQLAEITVEATTPVSWLQIHYLDFQAFSLYDIAFACGVGEIENYLGASAGEFFDDIQMKVAFLVGKTCNAEVLTTLDPQVAEFIELPNNVFNGAYVRGSASIPV
jgi:hypothetical protein